MTIDFRNCKKMNKIFTNWVDPKYRARNNTPSIRTLGSVTAENKNLKKQHIRFESIVIHSSSSMNSIYQIKCYGVIQK